MGQISGMCNVNSDPNHSKTKIELTVGVYWSCLCSLAFFFLNTWIYISSVNYPCILKPSFWEGEPTLILPHGMESMRCSISGIMYLPSRMLHCFSLNLKSSKEKMPVLSSHNRLALVLWVSGAGYHHPEFTVFEFLLQGEPLTCYLNLIQ